MTTIGYATLQVIPSLRGVSEAINRATRNMTIRANVEVDGAREAGRRAGNDIRQGVDQARIGEGARRNVEQELSSANGSRIGSRFGAGLGSAIMASIRGVNLDGVVSGGASVLRNIGAIATGTKVASFAARGLSQSLLAASGAFALLGGGGLGKLAAGLRFVSGAAGGAARDVGRITSSLVLLLAVGRGISTLNRLGKIAAIGTIGFSALLGVATALATMLGGPMLAAIAAVGAAMGAAAGAAAGILGPAIAALKIGFAGLGDAIKAHDASQKGSAATAKAAASAAKQVEQAEKSVERAKRESRDAERDLTRARKDAQEQLEDMALALRGASLSEKDAQLSLLEAHRDLQNLGKDGQPVDMIDRERAVLRVQEAEQRLAETQESNQDLAEKADEANRVGVEGSDTVVAAKQRVVDANQAVIDSEQQLADARQAAADAQSGDSGVDPFDAMIGQRMAPVLDAFKNLKHSVTDSLSSALIPGFQVAGKLLDGFAPKLSVLSGLFGTIGTEVATALSGPTATKGFDAMFAASDKFFSAFKGERGIGGLATGLVAFAGNAGTAFAGLGAGINSTLASWGDRLAKISPEMITAGFQQLHQVIKNIGAVVGPIIQFLRELGSISAPALAPGFAAIGHAIAQASPGVMAMARELMPALAKVMENLAPLLPSLVDAFTPWSTVIAAIAPHLATMVTHLGPLAPLIAAAALAVKGIGAAMVIWNGVMATASVAQGVFVAATGGSTTALGANTIALAAHRVAMTAGAVASRLFGAALTFATGPIGLVVMAIAALAAGIVYAYNHSETFRKIVDAAWKGIKIAAEAVVNWFVDTAWPWIKKAWDGIAEGAMWLWENAIKPAWEGIKAVIGFAWDVVSAIFNNWVHASKLVGEGAMWLWENAIKPAWEGIKAGIGAVWDFVSPIFDKFKAGWSVLSDGVTSGAKAIKDGFTNAFSGLADVLKVPLKLLGSFLTAIPTTILGFEVPGADKLNSWGKSLQSLSTGGFTGNLPIDQAAGVVHGREWVIKASSTDRIESDHPGLLDYMNKTGQLPGYQDGGRVGGMTPHAIQIRDIIRKQWPSITDIGGYRVDGYHEHDNGETWDIMIPGWNQPAGKALGDEILAWALKNKDALGLAGVIWRQTQYAYNGGTDPVPMEDRGSPTQNHFDHVHLNMGKYHGQNTPLTGAGAGVESAAAVSPSPLSNALAGKGLQEVSDSGTLMAEAGTGSGKAGNAPTSLTGLSSWGLEGLGVDTQTPTGTRRFEFGKAAGAAVSGQVGSLLGVLGVPDSPSWLGGLSNFVGQISIGGKVGSTGPVLGAGSAASHAGTGAAPGPVDDKNVLLYDEGGWLPEGMSLTENKTGGPEAILTQGMWDVARKGVGIAMSMAKGFAGAGGIKQQQPMAPPVTYNIQARDTEDAFIRARRQEDERSMAKLSRI